MCKVGCQIVVKKCKTVQLLWLCLRRLFWQLCPKSEHRLLWIVPHWRTPNMHTISKSRICHCLLYFWHKSKYQQYRPMIKTCFRYHFHEFSGTYIAGDITCTTIINAIPLRPVITVLTMLIIVIRCIYEVLICSTFTVNLYIPDGVIPVCIVLIRTISTSRRIVSLQLMSTVQPSTWWRSLNVIQTCLCQLWCWVIAASRHWPDIKHAL